MEAWHKVSHNDGKLFQVSFVGSSFILLDNIPIYILNDVD